MVLTQDSLSVFSERTKAYITIRSSSLSADTSSSHCSQLLDKRKARMSWLRLTIAQLRLSYFKMVYVRLAWLK